MLLIDLLELLVAGETLPTLRAMSGPGGEGSGLARLLAERIEKLPETARHRYRQQVGALAGRIRAVLEEEVHPGAPGLARLTLAAGLHTGAEVKVVRLFRPMARRSRAPSGP
jgi:hypothetical protein